jgi:OOP family OmpA-OmpF porin
MLASRAMARALGVAIGLSMAAGLVTSGSAQAAECDNALVSACINSDTLWPHAGPSRFVTVGSAETVADSRVSFGLITSYQSRPIVIHNPSPAPAGADATVIDNQVNGTFLFAYGVTKRLELDAMLPITFIQSGSGVSAITAGAELRDTTTRDARFGFTFAFLEQWDAAAKKLGLVGRFEVSAPLADKDQFAGENNGVLIPSLAADYRLGRLFLGAELGMRIRKTTELDGYRVGTQGFIGVGAGVDVLPRELLSVMVEARALPIFVEQGTPTQTPSGLTSTPNGKYTAPADWTVAVRTAPLAGGDLAFSLGGSGWLPISDQVGTPRFRFTLGIVFAPLARDTDRDGVLDTVDKCPHEKGTSKSEAGPGCPEPPPKPPEIIDTTLTPTPAPTPTPPPGGAP